MSKQIGEVRGFCVMASIGGVELHGDSVANPAHEAITLSAVEARTLAAALESAAIEHQRMDLLRELTRPAPSPTRVCGYETGPREFCNLPAPRFFYKYSDGRTIDLCARHAPEMRGSREREG